MRFAVLTIGWVLLCRTGPTCVYAEDIQGQLAITQTLTRQRVTLPAYDVRGVPARNHSENTDRAINEWKRVVVYLEGDRAPEAPRIIATVNQNGQRFEPETVVVPVGSTVSFPNSDPIFHNVFSLSKTKQFDLGYYPEGQTRLVKFDKPGVVQVYCHLHPHMSAAILVVPNAWYVRPDDRGAFSFSNIPPGTYQVVVWHKSAGFFRKKVQVTEGSAIRVSIEIPVERQHESGP
jgi:plastocyanin